MSPSSLLVNCWASNLSTSLRGASFGQFRLRHTVLSTTYYRFFEVIVLSASLCAALSLDSNILSISKFFIFLLPAFFRGPDRPLLCSCLFNLCTSLPATCFFLDREPSVCWVVLTVRSYWTAFLCHHVSWRQYSLVLCGVVLLGN